MPYNNKVQVVDGSVIPLNNFEDNSEIVAQNFGGRNPQNEIFIAQRVIGSNIRKLLAQQPPLPRGDLAEVTLEKDKLAMSFDTQETAQAFMQKLQKNGIKVRYDTGGEYGSRLIIEHNEAPKLLQGLLKMSDAQMENFYKHAKVTLPHQVMPENTPPLQTPQQRPLPQTPPNTKSSQTYTPGHSSQSATLQTRSSLSASNHSMKDLYHNLNRASESLGIKIKAGNIVNNKFEALANNTSGSFKAAEIVLGNQQNAPVCLAQEKQGGIDYSLGKNVTGANRNNAIAKVCQLAVQFGKSTEYAFPENADEKATFESLNNALKTKFGEGYPNNPDPEKLQKANMRKEEMPTIKGYERLIAKYPPSKPESRERATL